MTTFRKTKYDERGEVYFQGERASEPELPWRKWIRENLPRGPEGFCFEDVDGVAILFDPQRHVNRAFMLIEFKWWGTQLDRSQFEMLAMLDGLLRAGDPDGKLYRGVYVVEWHRTDEFARINYTQTLAHYRLKEFFLFRLNYPSYFEGNART